MTASFMYQISLELSGNYKLYKGPVQFCLRLLHGWPDNKLSIYPYYQLRSIKWCDGPILPFVSDMIRASNLRPITCLVT